MVFVIGCRPERHSSSDNRSDHWHTEGTRSVDLCQGPQPSHAWGRVEWCKLRCNDALTGGGDDVLFSRFRCSLWWDPGERLSGPMHLSSHRHPRLVQVGTLRAQSLVEVPPGMVGSELRSGRLGQSLGMWVEHRGGKPADRATAGEPVRCTVRDPLRVADERDQVLVRGIVLEKPSGKRAARLLTQHLKRRRELSESSLSNLGTDDTLTQQTPVDGRVPDHTVAVTQDVVVARAGIEDR